MICVSQVLCGYGVVLLQRLNKTSIFSINLLHLDADIWRINENIEAGIKTNNSKAFRIKPDICKNTTQLNQTHDDCSAQCSATHIELSSQVCWRWFCSLNLSRIVSSLCLTPLVVQQEITRRKQGEEERMLDQRSEQDSGSCFFPWFHKFFPVL